MITMQNLQKIHLCLFLIPALLFFQCADKGNDSNSSSEAEYAIHADSIGDVQKDSLINYISRIELVPLETNEQSLISNIRQIAVSDDYIYILDYRRNAVVKVFDRAGNYIRDAGGSGKGPGEYVYPAGIDWNPAQKALYVGDSRQGKVIKYDARGKFLEEITLSDSVRRFITFISTDNGNLLIPIRKDQQKDAENGFLALVGADGEILNKYFKEEGIATIYVNGDNTLRRLGGRILYTPIYSDIVYAFDQKSQTFSPYIKVTSPHEKDLELFEELEMEAREVGSMVDPTQNPQERFEKQQEIRGKYLAVRGVAELMETSEIIHFHFQYKGLEGSQSVLMDKKTGSLKKTYLNPPGNFFLSQKVPTTEFVVGELRWMNRREGTGDRIESMVDLIKDSASEAEIERIRAVNEEDNPVLAFFYFND